MPEHSDALCRAHPGTAAQAICTRCGDFMCALCGPLTRRPLCARCAARGAVDWEERGDQFWGRALWLTFWESLTRPRALGRRLAGAGRVSWALGYAALCTMIGALPLSLLIAALLLTVADPLTLGIRSTSVMGLAVSCVLASVGLATLLPLCLTAWASVVRIAARLFRIDARFDIVLRASAYGLSLAAVPVLGPVLLPLALLYMLSSVQAALAVAGDDLGALWAVLLAALFTFGPFALLFAG